MDILQMGSDILRERLGPQAAEPEAIRDALSQLLGGDLVGLTRRIAAQGGEFATMLASWLGDGENAPLTADKLLALLGERPVAQFAARIGAQTQDVAGALAEALPQMIDRARRNGELPDPAGAIVGLVDLAKSLLK